MWRLCGHYRSGEKDRSSQKNLSARCLRAHGLGITPHRFLSVLIIASNQPTIIYVLLHTKDMSDELWNEFETFEKSCGEVDANSTTYCNAFVCGSFFMYCMYVCMYLCIPCQFVMCFCFFLIQRFPQAPPACSKHIQRPQETHNKHRV